MPWTTATPPPPAKNWSAAKKKACVAAANATLERKSWADASAEEKKKIEQDAIFACIGAANNVESEESISMAKKNVTEEMSRSQQMQLIRSAFYDKFYPKVDEFGTKAVDSLDVWISDDNIFDDYLIAQVDGKYLRFGFMMGEAGDVVFTQGVEVEPIWQVVEAISSLKQAAAREAGRHAAEEDSLEKKAQAIAIKKKEGALSARKTLRIRRTIEAELVGKAWLVTIIKAGLSKNGNLYPPEVLEAAVSLFEGIKVFDAHQTDEEFYAGEPRKIKADYLGWIDGVEFVDDRLRGTLHVVESDLQEKMKAVWEAGRKEEFGLSIDVSVDATENYEVDGQTVTLVNEILEARSVDLVFDPAAGGKLERLLESNRAKTKEVSTMNVDQLVSVLMALDESGRAALLEAFTEAEQAILMEALEKKLPAPDEAPVQEEEEEIVEQEEEIVEEEEPVVEATPEVAPVAPASDPNFEKKLEAVNRRLYQIELQGRLKESTLPKVAREFLWEQFHGRIFEMKDVDRAIQAQKGVLDTLAPPESRPGGGIRLTAGAPTLVLGEFERAMERMLGVLDEGEKAPKDLYSLKRWYLALTEDHDFVGNISRRRMTEANVNTGTVTSIVKNALNKRLLAQYESAVSKRWWEPIVTHYAEDTINDVTVYQTYGFSALDTVAEGAAYTEKSWGDYEETASFVKKGNFVAITLETFMRDNLSALRVISDGLNKAWLRTIRDAVSALFTANSGDGATIGTTSRNWFNATEGNLGAAALAYASFDAAQAALAGMTEAGSSDPLGIYGKYLLVPRALRRTALEIRNSEKDPDAANNPVNVWQNEFEVIVVHKWTAATYWYLLADPTDAPLIGLHSYRGQETPLLISAENESAGSLFTNDAIRMKIRFWYALSLADHIGAYGSTP